MSDLWKYVIDHALRGACQCGQCVDAVQNPEKHQPKGHTVDLIFFKVMANPANLPNKEDFIKVVKEHKGEFGDVDLFDGKEHNYLELGGWAGDQGLALMTMGLGDLLGCWKLMTPMNMLPTGFNMKFVMELAGAGMITIQVQKEKGE